MKKNGRPPELVASPRITDKPFVRKLAAEIPMLLSARLLEIRDGYYLYLVQILGQPAKVAKTHLTNAAPFLEFLNRSKLFFSDWDNFRLPEHFRRDAKRRRKLSPRQIKDGFNEANRIVSFYVEHWRTKKKAKRPKPADADQEPEADDEGLTAKQYPLKSPLHVRTEANLPAIMGFDRLNYPSEAARESFKSMLEHVVTHLLEMQKAVRRNATSWNTYLCAEGGLKKFLRFSVETHRYVPPTHLPLNTIDDLMDWATALPNKASTVNGTVVATRRLLKSIAGVSTAVTSRRGMKLPPSEAHALEPSEVQKLNAALEKAPKKEYAYLVMKTLMEFLPTTGMRSGNVLDLEPKHVTTNTTTARDRAFFPKTKNRDSHYAPLTKRASELLGQLLNENRKLGITDRYFLTDPKSKTPLRYETFRRRFKGLVRAAELPEETKPHWYRGHFIVTLMKNKDPKTKMSMVEIQKAAVHKRLSSLGPYAKFAGDEIEQAVSDNLPIFEARSVDA